MLILYNSWNKGKKSDRKLKFIKPYNLYRSKPRLYHNMYAGYN